MTQERAYRISSGRLAEWADMLAKIPATPIALVALGHDSKSGEVYICVPDKIRDSEVSAIMQKALVLLNQGKSERIRGLL